MLETESRLSIFGREYKNNAREVSQHDIKGMAILSEEGKIGKFTILDDGLMEKIIQDQYLTT